MDMDSSEGLVSLLETADHVRLTDPDRAIASGLKALTLARAERDQRSQTHAYLLLAMVYNNLDDFQKSITYSGLCIRFCKEYKIREFLANAYTARATSYTRLLHLDRTLRDFGYALDEFESERTLNHDQIWTRASCFKNIGWLSSQINEHQTANLASKIALYYYLDLNEPQQAMFGRAARATILLDEARYHFELQPGEKADKLQEAKSLLDQLSCDAKMPNLLASANYAKGDYYYLTGDYEKAHHAYIASREVSKKSKFFTIDLLASARLAQTALTLNQLELAQEMLEEVNRSRVGLHNKLEEGHVCQILYACAVALDSPHQHQLSEDIYEFERRRRNQVLLLSNRLRAFEKRLTTIYNALNLENSSTFDQKSN